MAVLGLAGPALEPAALTHAALADPQGQEAGTVRLFLRILAAFAGDMAITFAATGGVFLGGGIVPRIRPLIEAQDFRRVFEDKAPVGRLVTHTPVRLIVSTDAVLAGMAAIAADPESYILDYVDRLWG
jgi:glucokinase